MEQKYEVKPVGVEYSCDKCGAPSMQATGLITPAQPTKYEHMCPECGGHALLDKNYPHVTFDRETPPAAPKGSEKKA